MRYAIVEAGVVTNVVISDTAIEQNWIQSDAAGIGDVYQNGQFTPQPQTAAEADRVRSRRNELLAESDYVTLRAVDQGVSVPADWVTYRQALRDITNNQNFPFLVPADWPVKP